MRGLEKGNRKVLSETTGKRSKSLLLPPPPAIYIHTHNIDVFLQISQLIGKEEKCVKMSIVITKAYFLRQG